jgi:mRNA-degrading endonuclease toxin of MazEF toxin-antitoxin module
MPVKGDDFSKGYVPARGDVVHLNWDPALGHEMKGLHYGLVLSQDAYNIGTGLVAVSPITSKVGKLSAFEFPIRAGRGNGVAVLSQFRTLDYQIRRVQYEGRITGEQIEEATRRVKMVL